jgi:predicted metal-binding membrane protein
VQPNTARLDRIAIASCIVVVTALAWAYLIQIDRQMSSVDSGTMMMNMGTAMTTPWATREILLAFVMWAVMMVGMMTAPAAPVFLLFARTQASSDKKGMPLTVLLFALGYITVWLGFSAAAVMLQWALRQAALLSPAMSASSPYLAGAILIAAGVYQLTPLKRACLSQCQSPLGFLMGNWRSGKGGAFGMGLHHGVYCLGCCWALMLVLFVVGVMNLVWVAVIAAFILLEKITPSGVFVSRAGAGIMIVFGLVLIAT